MSVELLYGKSVELLYGRVWSYCTVKSVELYVAT